MIVANSTMQNLIMLKFVLYFSIIASILLDEAQDTVDGGLRM